MTYSRQWLQESEMRLERQSLALPELKGRSPYACLLLTLPARAPAWTVESLLQFLLLAAGPLWGWV